MVRCLALPEVREYIISDMALGLLFDWRARFAIWTCLSSRSDVAALSAASILEELVT